MIQAKFTVLVWADTDEAIDDAVRRLDTPFVEVFVHERSREEIDGGPVLAR